MSDTIPLDVYDDADLIEPFALPPLQPMEIQDG